VPGFNTFATRNYHQNVLNAFRTASGLSRAAAGLPGAKKYFIAHSLGNMLVSSARQDHGLQYEKYLMLNAAVQLEAYDADEGVTEQSKHDMTPPEWRAYPDVVRASRWHELFGEDDARRALTWKGRFKDVDKTVNFYSSKDEVVANGDGTEKSIFSREYAWYNQERFKGTRLVDFIPEPGWGFGRNAYVRYVAGHLHGEPVYSTRLKTVTEAQNTNTNDLKTCPFFRDFTESGIYGEGGGGFVTSHDYFRWRVLSHGIPAESFATGANPVPKWEKESCNVDMATQCKPDQNDPNPIMWMHSYYIGKPLKDTFRLYDEIVNRTNSSKDGE